MNFFSYIVKLVDKADPASTHSYLTIISVLITLLLITVSVLGFKWNPQIGLVAMLFTNLLSLLGIQALKEVKDKKD